MSPSLPSWTSVLVQLVWMLRGSYILTVERFVINIIIILASIIIMTFAVCRRG